MVSLLVAAKLHAHGVAMIERPDEASDSALAIARPERDRALAVMRVA
jgi:hypothetical protein